VVLQTQQLDAVHMKYGGTGNPETSKYEWMVNQHRDTYASLVGHHDAVAFHSIAENQSLARTRYGFLTRIVKPCGDAPAAPAKKKKR
jgi:splicing factor 3B subunit 5